MVSPNSGTFKANESTARERSPDVNQGKQRAKSSVALTRFQAEHLVLKGRETEKEAGLDADGCLFPLTTAVRRNAMSARSHY